MASEFDLTANVKPVWKLNLISYELTTPDNKVTELKPRECKLIYLLALKNGAPVNKQFVNVKLLGKHVQKDNRSIDVMLAKLRKKVLGVSKFALPIRTLHGVGYSLSRQFIIE